MRLLDHECRRCGRTFKRSPSSKTSKCGHCSTGVVVDHTWIRARERICRGCEHWGDHRRGRNVYTGCDLLDKPCDAEALITTWESACPLGKYGPGNPPRANHASKPNPEQYSLGDRVRVDQSPESTYYSESDLTGDSVRLANLVADQGWDLSAVAGVPRSGMVPASIIAMRLDLPLLAATRDGIFDTIGGTRGRKIPRRPGTILLVDDSIATGRSLAESAARIDQPIKRASVYCTPRGIPLVDAYAVELALPHYFEWNLFCSPHMSGHHYGIDFDGILCTDCPPQYDDDGECYLQFLENAFPIRTIGQWPVKAIVTARLEKYRPHTEDWLRRHGIRYGRLVMGPWATIHQRRGQCIGSWKAQQIIDHDLHHFVESDPVQARIIHEKTGRITICPAEKRVYPWRPMK